MARNDRSEKPLAYSVSSRRTNPIADSRTGSPDTSSQTDTIQTGSRYFVMRVSPSANTIRGAKRPVRPARRRSRSARGSPSRWARREWAATARITSEIERPQQRSTETAIRQGVEQAVAGEHHAGTGKGPPRGKPERRRRESERGGDANANVRECVAPRWPHGSPVLDAERKADDVGVWQERQGGPPRYGRPVRGRGVARYARAAAIPTAMCPRLGIGRGSRAG